MFDYQSYLRLNHFPLIWCPGCGNGVVMKSMLRAIDNLRLPRDKVCVVSGIGCSSRLSGYLDFNTVHTTHGRALTFATGIKMAKPELTVIVVTGDGDCTAIGGNHFIHAARRNIDLTVILINNLIYGMTGGQHSPTTPSGSRASTAPFGNSENTFNVSGLAIAAGASFVARSTTYHAQQCDKLIEKGIQTPGFALIEIMAACPTSFGRANKAGSPADMMRWQRDHAVTAQRAEKMSPEELQDKFTIGVLAENPRPECRTEYQKLIDRLREQEAKA